MFSFETLLLYKFNFLFQAKRKIKERTTADDTTAPIIIIVLSFLAYYVTILEHPLVKVSVLSSCMIWFERQILHWFVISHLAQFSSEEHVIHRLFV